MVEISGNGIAVLVGFQIARSTRFMQPQQIDVERERREWTSAVSIKCVCVCARVQKVTKPNGQPKLVSAIAMSLSLFCLCRSSIYPIAFHLILFDLHRCWYGIQSGWSLHLLKPRHTHCVNACAIARARGKRTLTCSICVIEYWILSASMSFYVNILYQFISSSFVDMFPQSHYIQLPIFVWMERNGTNGYLFGFQFWFFTHRTTYYWSLLELENSR